ncbi:MAG TPA: hypothetical protein VG204_10180 [Terriglobia bacterium]|nr:hypothetical protein [Terriglobia bacterium]
MITLSQVTDLFQGLSRHHREVTELVKAGKAEQERGDYPAAFASYENALKLNPASRPAREGEARAAMRWLDNIRGDGHTFTEVADRLLPVLDQAATSAKGSQAADLAAHVGWANFLKYREGSREGVTVEENYRRAIALDPNNVYAHAMWGHWILWQNGNLDEAKRHFSAALASGRERSYVRGLQLSALLNLERPDAEAELVRVANEMRKSGESIPERDRNRILDDYEMAFHDHHALVALLSALPPADAEATFVWLDAGRGDEPQLKNWRRDFVAANLKEIAGDRTEALSTYQSLQKELRGSSSALVSSVDDGIRRLSGKR